MNSRLLTAAFASLLLASVELFSAPSLRWEEGAGYRSMSISPGLPHRTGFTLLSSAETGIGFTNVLSLATASKNHNLLQGSGVAAGDFDNDGWCDLYFANIEGRNTLYRNLGGLRFEDVTDKAAAACPGMFSTGAVFADANGDGWLDLFVTGNNGPNALLLNQRNGRFTNVTASAGLVSRPLGAMSAAFADLDGNGALDLFVANYGENTILRTGGEVSIRMINGRPVVSGRAGRRLKFFNGGLIEFGEPSAVYLNDGQGRFRQLSWTDGTFLDEDGAPLRELLMDLSLSVMMRDINGDGAPDIYVCNDFQTPDRIWINDGRARFRALPRLAMRQVSHFSMGVDFADLDRDGHDDFIVVDMLSRKHALRMTQMIETNLVIVAPGEIDNRPQVRRNALFWNRGDGTYAEVAHFAGIEASDWSWTPAFLDVDLDGFEDLLVSNGHAFDTQDLDAAAKPTPRGVGKELATYPKLETPNYAFRNRGNLTFEETGAAWGFTSTQVCHGIAFADLDNDGDLEAVVSSLNAPALIYRNNAAAPRIAVRLKGRAPNTRGINARIVVRGGAVPVQAQEMICGGRYVSSDEPVRTFAAGSLTNRMTIEVRWRSGTRSVVRDALPNRIYEIDEAGAQPASPPVRPSPPLPLFRDASVMLAHRHHEPAFDDFARQPLLSRKLSQGGPGMAWTDVTGEGRDDLVIGTGQGGALAVAVAAGARASFGLTNIANLATDDLLGMTRWARDGRSALLIARAGYETPGAAALLLCTASREGLAVQPVPAPLTSPRALSSGDLLGDGTLHLFVAGLKPGRYPEPGDAQILREENGRFVVATQSRALAGVGLVSAATWSDLDSDGYPELVLACDWGPVRVFKNQRGTLVEATRALKLEAFTGWWTSVTTGDVDGDGRLDIIAGNWGLNTAWSSSAAAPQRIYYGDFAGDGGVQIIEAEMDGVAGSVLPRENLTLLGPALPFLRGRFASYASFRDITVRSALGERWHVGRELTAATLSSTVFLNRGDSFEARPLPVEAQWAPVFGISVADADGDGDEDIFLAQNFFAVRKDLSRLDAGRGLWLRNDGRGELRPMAAEESGVAIWGEQRGCAVGDFDGDARVDLAVAQNGAETKLFHNEKAKPGWRIRLKGPPGNPDGVGAVVRLKHGGRYGPAREVRGGAGYLSQDSATLVMSSGDEKPTHVWVRWPGGKTSEIQLEANRDIQIEFGK